MVFIFLYSASFAQKDYRKFRKNLFTQTNEVDTFNVQSHLITIDKIQAHIEANPNHYDAYYDLGMEYYTLASKEKLKDSKFWQQSIDAFNNYVENAPKKRKFLGYQNLAVIYGLLDNCKEVQLYMKLRNDATPKKIKSTFIESANTCIRSTCLEKEN